MDENVPVPQVNVQVSTGAARLGDLVTLDIQVHHPLFLIVQPPAWPKTLATFEVVASTAFPLETSPAEAVSHFQAQLQNFTTGPQLLPALDIPYQDPMGHWHMVKTATRTVTIQDVPADPKANGDIRGIRGVVGAVAWSPLWWFLIAFLISGLCFLLWRQRKRSIIGPPPPPPEPADDKALRRLRELQATGWLESGKIKEFYSGISDIVRMYLEEAFKTPALERTTGEIFRQLRRKTEIPQDAQNALKELLENCDLVKFAKFLPDPEEGTKDHATAVRFVEMTQAVIPAKPPQDGRVRPTSGGAGNQSTSRSS